MNNDDLLEDSDSSDEDYVPDAKPNEQLSEIESDDDFVEPLSDSEETTGKATKKRKRKTTKSKKKQKIDTEEIVQVPEKQEELTGEEKKKKDDDLWADFLKDTGFQSRNNKNTNEIQTQQKPNSNEPQQSTTTQTRTKPENKVKITQIFEFAGEEVKIEKEVAHDSAEARLLNKTSPETSSNSNSNVNNKVRTKGGLSGISNVLSQLGRKPKITTLEKSKLDWDQFKKEENLDDELRTFNKGKDGYLEKQDFLQRADLRRFEIEKEIRSIERNKRLNN